jgi:hypothetical protein
MARKSPGIICTALTSLVWSFSEGFPEIGDSPRPRATAKIWLKCRIPHQIKDCKGKCEGISQQCSDCVPTRSSRQQTCALGEDNSIQFNSKFIEHRDLTQRRWMSYLEGQNQLLDLSRPSRKKITLITTIRVIFFASNPCVIDYQCVISRIPVFFLCFYQLLIFLFIWDVTIGGPPGRHFCCFRKFPFSFD